MLRLRQSLMEEVGKDNLPSQQLGIDDLVAVSVYDAPELTRTVRVKPTARFICRCFTTASRRPACFPASWRPRVAGELKTSEQILVDPVVKVTVVEYHSRPISVMGAVKMPVTFQAVGVVTLLDALASAGGPHDLAGTEIAGHRRQDGAPVGARARQSPDQRRRPRVSTSCSTAAKRSAFPKPARSSWSAMSRSPARSWCATAAKIPC